MNTIYQEVVSLPFNSEYKEQFQKTAFMFDDIVTCDRGVGGEHRLPRGCEKAVLHQVIRRAK
ncbi:hypothetical protein EFP6CSP_04565 [Enterococcus faecium]|nr:hypothetical protein EFP6CSP_04565 [Enterococcus faecium]